MKINPKLAGGKEIKLMVDSKKIEPFLKWAGGKRWLVNHYSHLFPKTFNRYIEPFLGSGAVFFHLKPSKAYLSDSNSELIGAYCAIRDNWKMVFSGLKKHHLKHSKKYYYLIRDSKPSHPVDKAIRFIYLNRTCWNGLYRVNLNGEFNVPKGTKTKVLMPEDDFERISKMLKKIKIKCQDFEGVINSAKKGDFLFIDPPYTVTHNQNNFIKYNEVLFSWDDQIRLRDCLFKAKKRGSYIFLTNANHQAVKELYLREFEMIPVERASIIAADPKKRKNYTELIFKA